MNIFNLVTTDRTNNEWILRSNEAVRKLSQEDRQEVLDACKRHNARIYNRPYVAPLLTTTERFRRNLSEFKTMRSEAKNSLDADVVYVDNLTLIKFERKETADWNYYAKSYKFPKVAVTNSANKIQFIKGEIVRDRRIMKDQRESSRIAATSALIGPIQSSAPMAVRLNKLCDAKLERSLLGCEVWERSVCGIHIDYVARCGKITYHAQSRLGAISGIKAKINAKSAPDKIITIEYCKSLNFCNAGINQFIKDAGLSGRSEISAAELKEIVKSKKLRSTYSHELSVLGV